MQTWHFSLKDEWKTVTNALTYSLRILQEFGFHFPNRNSFYNEKNHLVWNKKKVGGHKTLSLRDDGSHACPSVPVSLLTEAESKGKQGKEQDKNWDLIVSNTSEPFQLLGLWADAIPLSPAALQGYLSHTFATHDVPLQEDLQFSHWVSNHSLFRASKLLLSVLLGGSKMFVVGKRPAVSAQPLSPLCSCFVYMMWAGRWDFGDVEQCSSTDTGIEYNNINPFERLIDSLPSCHKEKRK